MKCNFRSKEECLDPATKIIIFRAGKFFARELCDHHYDYLKTNKMAIEEFKTVKDRDLEMIKREL